VVFASGSLAFRDEKKNGGAIDSAVPLEELDQDLTSNQNFTWKPR